MKQKTKIFLATICFLFAANLTSAQLVNCTDCTLNDLILTVRVIINFFLSWAWLISILFIVISGFRMMLSRGNDEALSAAKTSLAQAIGGFIIILTSYVILNLVIGLITGGGGLNSGALGNALQCATALSGC